jgi:HlyD family secretion protein
MKRVVIVVGVLVLAAAAFFGFRAWQQNRQSETESWQEVRVTRDDLVVAVSATGNIAAERSLNLLFNATGVVEEVAVERGQIVEAGELLARLETDDLELAVRQARAALAAARASLAQATAPPRPQEIDQAELAVASAQAGLAAAQADLASAQARLAQARAVVAEEDLTIAQLDVASARVRLSQLQAAPDETAAEIARLNWEIAKNSLWQAQLQRDATLAQPVPGYQKELAKASVGAAELSARISELRYRQSQEGAGEEEVRLGQIAIDQAQARLDKLESPTTEEDLAVAQAAVDAARARVETAQVQVDQAELSLALLLAGPRQEQIDALEAQVAQAQVTLEQAQLRLEKARLTAPFDGVVAQVNVKEGTVAPTGAPAVELVDLSRFEMEVQIDELDVGQVRKGLPVRVTLDALPDAELEGRVEAIAPTAFQGGGVVAYLVTIGLEVGEAPVKEGMSATANIVTQRLDDVLVVPNRALRLDQETGEIHAEKLVLGAPKEVRVEIGYRDELVSQVLDGLEEGDTVIIRTVSSRERLREAFGPPQ